MNKQRLTTILLTILLLGFSSTAFADDNPIKAVRFDAGYYYDHPDAQDVVALSATLCDQWAQNGVNTVYYLVYSADGGARYRSRYLHNRMEEFGVKDLMGAMIDAAHARDMKVIAWFFDRQHKQAWRAHPSWRVKQYNGRDYKDRTEDYFLSPSSPEASDWWNGLIEDLLVTYPDIDGVDIAEPLINWWGNKAGFHPVAVEQFRRDHRRAALNSLEWLEFRADKLTDHLTRSIATVHRFEKPAHLTIIMTANSSGRLLSNREQMINTGLDLDAILDDTDRPDFVNAELIWQQWKAEHVAARFSPQWTRTATVQALANLGDRSELIVHVEQSTFGTQTPQPGDLNDALAAAKSAGAVHLDCYDTNILDQQDRWSELAGQYQSTTGTVVARIDRESSN